MGNSMNIFIYCYQCIKLFLNTKPILPFYLQYTPPRDALVEDHFKMTPHFKQLCYMDTFNGKRVAISQFIFFCSLFVYLLKCRRK